MAVAINTTTVWGANSSGGTGIIQPPTYAANFTAWFNSLPTVDPSPLVGIAWNNGGVLCVSE